jgi:hypothetical protein
VIAGAHYSDTLLVRKLLAVLPNASLELSGQSGAIARMRNVMTNLNPML